jgi:ubiquinone/menaquinone biosynthesis C-methylase UbiE
MNSIEKKTRAVYHDIHIKQSENKEVFSRLTQLMSPNYLKEDDDFFKGKVCLDAGCGSHAWTTYSMLKHGAEKVYAFDLDETIFEKAPEYLKEFEGKYELKVDNVLNMQFDDNFFDFVHCGGVLHHTTDLPGGIKELGRVTKNGGILEIHTYGKGGLVRELTSYLREKYKRDEEFKTLIDKIDAQYFEKFFQEIFSIMKDNDDRFINLPTKDVMQSLFDEDLALTIKDRIKSPVYLEHSEEEIIAFLKDAGFSSAPRLTRYPVYRNIRKFLSPLYYKYNSEFSKLLYGSGAIQIKAKKDAE